MKKKEYTLISKGDLQRLVDDGHVKFHYGNYSFRGGMPRYLSMDKVMRDDILSDDRRTFIYDEMDMSKDIDPFLPGLSDDFACPWFVPCWCVLEWLEYEGIEL